MKGTPTILYVQHADSVGGSAISMREVVRDSVAYGYKCLVFCKNEAVAAIYRDTGASVHCGTVATFNHNTALFYRFTPMDSLRVIKALLRTVKGFVKIYPVVRQARPDIVHLNSSNLILYALFFRILGIPTIIHVREMIVKGYFGFRRRMLRMLFNLWPTYVIYISESEQHVLRTNPVKSAVIYNYVHEAEFCRQGSGAVPASPGSLRVLTLGGLFALKGGNVILESLRSSPGVSLLVLGCEDPRTDRAEIEQRDGAPYADAILALLKEDAVAGKVVFGGKVDNPAQFIAASDCVLFWAASPHFPRPVFEAWLFKKPVIYFNPEFRNQYIGKDTVFELPGNSAAQLSEAYGQVLSRRPHMAAMLERAYQIARDNFTERNFLKIHNLYQQCLAGSGTGV